MRKKELKLQKTTYTILFICLFLINFSLLCTAFHILFPDFNSETSRWIRLHGAVVFDTICASVLLTLGGAWGYEHTYRNEKNKSA